MVATSAKPIGYYISSSKNRVQELLDQLQENWGSRLEGIDTAWKLLFRAALVNYRAQEWYYDESSNSISCIDHCIVCAGGDDLNVWDEFPLLVEFIQAIAKEFPPKSIEDLIVALTEQLRGS